MKPVEGVCAWIGLKVREVRTSVRWTQAELGEAVGVSQSVISVIEAGREPELTVRRAEGLFVAMGARLSLNVDPPRVSGSDMRDPVHARCCLYVVRRLERAGWSVRTEVEVGGDRSRGWIDVLAFHPTTCMLLVTECKSEIRDLGQIERTQNWYEREAPAAARRYGWRPAGVGSLLALLASDDNDRTTLHFRAVLERQFGARGRKLSASIDSGEVPPGARGLAMIDPRSRRQAWLRPLRIDGRRTPAPYRDYLDCLRILERRRRDRSTPDR